MGWRLRLSYSRCSAGDRPPSLSHRSRCGTTVYFGSRADAIPASKTAEPGSDGRRQRGPRRRSPTRPGCVGRAARRRRPRPATPVPPAPVGRCVPSGRARWAVPSAPSGGRRSVRRRRRRRRAAAPARSPRPAPRSARPRTRLASALPAKTNGSCGYAVVPGRYGGVGEQHRRCRWPAPARWPRRPARRRCRPAAPPGGRGRARRDAAAAARARRPRPRRPPVRTRRGSRCPPTSARSAWPPAACGGTGPAGRGRGPGSTCWRRRAPRAVQPPDPAQRRAARSGRRPRPSSAHPAARPPVNR